MIAKYTEVLKNIMDSPYTKEDLHAALSTYPLYEGKKEYDLIPKRSELNEKILNHYKYREIGFETIERFMDELEITMKEIMPQYNELFKTVETMADLPNPFDNVDFIEAFEQSRTSTNSGSEQFENTGSESSNTSSEGSETDHNKNVFTDTPQSTIGYPAKHIDSVDHASNVSWDSKNETSTSDVEHSGETNSSGTSSSEHTTTDTMRYEHKKIGNQGVNTYAHDMNEFRTSIIDVVDQIINDERLNNLFMLVY